MLLLYSGKTLIANEKGLHYLQDDSTQLIKSFLQNGIGNYVYDALEISPNVIIMATCKGLLRFNLNTNTLDTLFASSTYCIRTLWSYKDYIFFGTYGNGFYALKNDKVKALPIDKNRYLLYVHCFMPDALGFCWLSTNRGLFKVSINDMENYLQNKCDNIYYHYLGRKDGMQITEMNGGCKPCALT